MTFLSMWEHTWRSTLTRYSRYLHPHLSHLNIVLHCIQHLLCIVDSQNHEIHIPEVDRIEGLVLPCDDDGSLVGWCADFETDAVIREEDEPGGISTYFLCWGMDIIKPHLPLTDGAFLYNFLYSPARIIWTSHESMARLIWRRTVRRVLPNLTAIAFILSVVNRLGRESRMTVRVAAL